MRFPWVASSVICCSAACSNVSNSKYDATTAPLPLEAREGVLAPTPPMGWNNWAHYTCGIDQAAVIANADALVARGLAAKGYDTVTIDDCWMTKARDKDGNLVVDAGRFPKGMAWLGAYLHDRKLKFGIYEDAGTTTCGGFAGSYGHFEADAKLFASWGVDYVKLDGCNVPNEPGKTLEQTYRSVYAAMGAALASRNIVFSESAPAYFMSSSDWYTILGWVAEYGSLWREGDDIANYDKNHPDASRWASVMTNYDYNHPLGRYAGRGHWNDPDFIIAGDGGLTDDESKSQISLWSMMAAPLILSSNVAALSDSTVAALGNPGVLAIDQDALGVQGTLASSDGTTDVLYKPLANGDRAVAILNRGPSTLAAKVSLEAIGYGAACSYRLRDVWTGRVTTGSGAISATIPSHATALYALTPQAGCGDFHPTGQILATSGQCVDDAGNDPELRGLPRATFNAANGNGIVLYHCTGNPNQRWTLPGDGTVRSLGHCLATRNGGSASGTDVTLNPCDGSDAQKWNYLPSGNLVHRKSGLCLDAYGGSTAEGTRLIVYACGTQQLNQTWSLPGR